MADSNQNTIASAIIEASKNIKPLFKGQENTHDRYKFASIDDFIEHTREPIALAGLAIVMDEVDKPILHEFQTREGKLSMRQECRFAFTIFHSGGEKIAPFHRSVIVYATGAQASGSAQSYALKQFIRSTFMVPTNDKDDPDTHASSDIMRTSTAEKTRESDPQKKARFSYDRLGKAKDLDGLHEIWEKEAINIEEIKQKNPEIHQHLVARYNKIKGGFDAA